jgi:hypothetical protein
MIEDKRKHLEFIQNVITRMNTNSFLIKGWSITLVSALFALAAKDSNPKFISISFFVIVLFWFLDGFYLSQERQYRELYKEIVKLVEEQTNFSMDASKFNKGKNTWFKSIFSKTLNLFYLLSLLTVILTAFIIFFSTQEVQQICHCIKK